MSGDKETTIQDIKDLLETFRKERDWGEYHDPKNLAEAIAIEAGELMEHFLWQKDNKVAIEKLKTDPEYRKDVGEELADVILYCLSFATATGIDVATVAKEKIKKNGIKYPIEKSKGNAKKYTEL